VCRRLRRPASCRGGGRSLRAGGVAELTGRERLRAEVPRRAGAPRGAVPPPVPDDVLRVDIIRLEMLKFEELYSFKP
jgi:hypothetical protein